MEFETGEVDFETVSGFETGGVDFEPARVHFKTVGVDFETAGVEFETGEVDFETVGVDLKRAEWTLKRLENSLWNYIGGMEDHIGTTDFESELLSSVSCVPLRLLAAPAPQTTNQQLRRASAFTWIKLDALRCHFPEHVPILTTSP